MLHLRDNGDNIDNLIGRSTLTTKVTSHKKVMTTLLGHTAQTAAVSTDDPSLGYSHTHTQAFWPDRPTQEQTGPLIGQYLQNHRALSAPDWPLSRHKSNREEVSLCDRVAVVVGGGCGVHAHTDISYVVPPTPVTFLTLLWRLGLRLAPWVPGWQSICPLTFMASLNGNRRR